MTNSSPEIAAPEILAIPPPAIDVPNEPPSAEPGASGAGESSAGIEPGKVIGPGEAAVPGDKAALAAQLQQQREDLRLLLTESGLIGERTCRAARDDIKAELSYLEEPGSLLTGPRDGRTEDRVADLLRQRKGLRGKLIAGELSEDFYNEEVADISAKLMHVGWSQ